MSAERWEDARRVEAWAGEVRVNLLRALALIVFSAHHLLQVYVLRDGPTGAAYHAQVSGLVLLWALGVLALHHLLLARRWAPPALKYVVTFADLALVTALLMVNPDGPRSPLVFLYFVVLAASPLRLSLGLVQATTFATWAAALALWAHHVFVRVGRARYYDPEAGQRIALHSEVLFLLAVGAAGLFAGQAVRQTRRVALGHGVRVASAPEKDRE